MKDKLEKHGKKHAYFFWRKVLFVSLAVTLFAAAVAVPLSISIAIYNSSIVVSTK